MTAKWATRIGLLLATVIGWFWTGHVFLSTTVAHGAAGVSDAGWMAQIFGAITSSGLTVATVVSFLKTWAPSVIHAVMPDAKLPDLSDPKIQKEVTDVVELGEATLGYLANRDDKGAQRRFVLAAVTELGDIAELKSPDIAKAVSELGGAIAARWFPSPAQSETVK